MIEGLILLLEWKTRLAIGGYEKLSYLAPLEVIQQGVELLQGIEGEKLELSKQVIQTIQTFLN